MKSTTLVTLVLAVLVLVAVVQAVQLNGLKDKVESGSFSTGTASSSSQPVASSGGASAPKALPASIKDLPTMVGGC